jgi:N-acetyl-gamma-glutamyl-phosphate reductase
MPNRLKVAVIGATGYSGAEIVHLLLKHPLVDISTLMTANLERKEAPPQKLSEALPEFSRRCELEIEPLDFGLLEKREISAVFVATPNETSHEIVPQLLQRNLRVLDLSGAFRLRQKSLYPKWYGFEHLHPELLESAVYGLTEVNREIIRKAQLLANPGCYPTSALLPLIPLQRRRLIDMEHDIVCDSKSGVSGAGKTPTAGTHFSEVSESFKAYNVFKHRHAPEIWQELGNSHLIFTPHLLPINRGILSTLYVKTLSSVSEAMVTECFQQAYAGEPFVRLFSGGAFPEIKFVAHTNFCDIGWKLDPARCNLVMVSAIDNLVKGAAGQAIQNMNVMLGLEETAGLL